MEHDSQRAKDILRYRIERIDDHFNRLTSGFAEICTEAGRRGLDAENAC